MPKPPAEDLEKQLEENRDKWQDDELDKLFTDEPEDDSLPASDDDDEDDESLEESDTEDDEEEDDEEEEGDIPDELMLDRERPSPKPSNLSEADVDLISKFRELTAGDEPWLQDEKFKEFVKLNEAGLGRLTTVASREEQFARVTSALQRQLAHVGLSLEDLGDVDWDKKLQTNLRARGGHEEPVKEVTDDTDPDEIDDDFADSPALRKLRDENKALRGDLDTINNRDVETRVQGSFEEARDYWFNENPLLKKLAAEDEYGPEFKRMVYDSISGGDVNAKMAFLGRDGSGMEIKKVFDDFSQLTRVAYRAAQKAFRKKADAEEEDSEAEAAQPTRRKVKPMSKARNSQAVRKQKNTKRPAATNEDGSQRDIDDQLDEFRDSFNESFG